MPPYCSYKAIQVSWRIDVPSCFKKLHWTLRSCASFLNIRYIYMQFSRAKGKARLGHLIGLLSLFQHTCAEGEVSYCTMAGSYMPRSAVCHWTFFPVSQTSYKQVSKQLAKFMLDGENMDSAVCFASALYFGYKFNAHFPQSSWDSWFLPGFLLQIYAVWVPGHRPRQGLLIIQRTHTEGPAEVHTCRINSTPKSIIWVC